MRLNSITVKLLVIIVGAFVVTIVAILILADLQLKRILDESQEAVYTERVDTITGFLRRSNERLKKTGLVEAYADDFKQSALTFLRKSYYKQPDPAIYPFIIDTRGTVIMHPVLPHGDHSLNKAQIAQQLVSTNDGQFDAVYRGGAKWYRYRLFAEWDWVIAYSVPLTIKYRDAHMFRNMLIVISAGVAIVVLLILALVVRRFTRPIVKLTDASKQIAGGNLDHPIELNRSDEIGILASAFVQMRDSIQNQIEDLNNEIRERKHAEKELQKLRNYLSNIIDSMPSAIVGVDKEGCVTQWNKTVEQATGINAAQARGKILSDLMPWMASEMNKIKDSINSRQLRKEQKKSRSLADGTCFEDVTIYPLITNGVEGAVIRIDDVTEQVRMEEMMIQSEKMLSVGGLAAGMAHEINNPLAGMIQTARVMANRLEQNSTIKANLKAAEKAGTSMEAIGAFMEARGILRMVDTIVESGQRVADIVANMLSFARKSEARISTHSLVDLLEKTLELAATDYDLKKHYDFKLIEVVKEYADSLPAVPCEGAKIQQVLLNLLRNGAQAMQENATANPRFIIRAYVERRTQMACVEIEDNGPGMDETTRKRVFEPFFTTKPVGVGTGLGLSVSYFIIVENHRGEMAVDSTPGSGSRFIIRLPMKGLGA